MTSESLGVGGTFLVEAFDVDGSKLWEEKFHNGVNNGALNDLLNVYLNGGTQKTAWYFALIDNAGFSALSASDTAASHSGWSECTAYSESVRQTWTPSSASGQSITNPSSAVFTANGSVTVNGLFLISSSTKGGTSGQLWATGSFSSTQSLTASQTIKCSYTLAAAGS